MYEAFYGLKEKPFALTPDPSFLFLAKPHRKALVMLQYSLESDSAFCLLTGEVGSGKTTLIRHLLGRMEQRTTVGLISNTSANFGKLLQWVCASFGLDYHARDKVTLYERFAKFLIDEYAKGNKVVLIVDEAQNLPRARLEELRVLSNINADKHLLLQIVLVGQPELRRLIRSPRMVQLAQRIGGDYHIVPLTGEETRSYVHHRLRVAGGKLTLFSNGAINLVYKASRGIPRLINQLCDRALVYAYADQAPSVHSDMMRIVIEDRRSGGLLPNYVEPVDTAPVTPLSIRTADG
jgi:general secretion pathway protein A